MTVQTLAEQLASARSETELFDAVNRQLEATAQPHHFWGTWRDLVSWIRGEMYSTSDDERLQVFRMIREAGLFPDNAASFLVLWTLQRQEPLPTGHESLANWLRERDEGRLATRLEEDPQGFERDVAAGRDLLLTESASDSGASMPGP